MGLLLLLLHQTSSKQHSHIGSCRRSVLVAALLRAALVGPQLVGVENYTSAFPSFTEGYIKTRLKISVQLLQVIHAGRWPGKCPSSVLDNKICAEY